MKTSKWIAAAFAGTLLSCAAQAAFLTGTFSGFAVDSERVQGVEMFGDFDGARVNGSFGFDSNGAGLTPAWLKFDVPGVVSYDFTGETAAHFAGNGLTDSIVLDANPTLMIPSGSFRIVGPAGSLSIAPGGGIDLSAFDPASIPLAYLGGEFGARRGASASIHFDQFAFDGYPAEVPEPRTLALFGCGLLALALLGRRKRNKHR
jgi:hypothetical protein